MNGAVVFVFVRLVWDVVSGAVVITYLLQCNQILIVLLSGADCAGLASALPSFLTAHPLVYAPHCLFAVFSFAEGSEANITFSRWSEAHARCAYYACAVEKLVEELP